MRREERWYFLERARTSLEQSGQAADPAIAHIHLELYERYMELAKQPVEPGAVLRVVPRQPGHGAAG